MYSSWINSDIVSIFSGVMYLEGRSKCSSSNISSSLTIYPKSGVLCHELHSIRIQNHHTRTRVVKSRRFCATVLVTASSIFFRVVSSLLFLHSSTCIGAVKVCLQSCNAWYASPTTWSSAPSHSMPVLILYSRSFSLNSVSN